MREDLDLSIHNKHIYRERTDSDIVSLFDPRSGVSFSYLVIIKSMTHKVTHTRYGRSKLSSLGHLTHTRRADGGPESDGDLMTVSRAKIRHYRQLYINHPEPIAFMPVAVDTSRPCL